jgi:hypothetical protein
MNPKTQAKALALGGFLCLIGLGTGNVSGGIFGILYAGFTCVIGFYNWIELDKKDSQSHGGTK